MMHNGKHMKSCQLRAISNQGTTKVETGYKPSHTSETLTGYIVCCRLGVIQFNPVKFNCFILFSRFF